MKPNYAIVEVTNDCVLIRDLGPWNRHMTVTNGAEEVVAKLAPLLDGRRLEYIDSEGQRNQILVRDGRFAGFAPAKSVQGRAVTQRMRATIGRTREGTAR